MELLLGCGSRRDKHLHRVGHEEWEGLVTVDINPSHNPDIIHDLEQIPLPFEDNSADEIHLYEVLEHLGRQGDWKFFFAQFEDFWRILKPNGVLFASTPHPTSIWCWGDPGHTRSLPPECLTYLDQDEYTAQIGHTALTDYRPWYKGHFKTINLGITEKKTTFFALQALK